ncbi:MAG: pimeloyl-ACP methyl ester carboxylesterase [Acidimicrobiales bacterium]|jgi:pimeloyl-ACP methyl ester carboxylesterase
MKTFNIDGGTLEYSVRGDGPPLLLLHGSVVADPWEPMLSFAGLLGDYRVVTYRRRGYGGSLPAQAGRTLSDEGADAVALLDHLDINRAHAVGHSLAADILLQAAIDAPERFAAIALLEPGLFSVPSAAGFDKAIRPVVQTFESGDHYPAMLLFLGGPGGSDVLARLEEALPEGMTEMALAAVTTLFLSDIPAGSGWTLDEGAAQSLAHPILLALGSDSGPIFSESNEVLAALLPNVEKLDLADTGHFVHVEQPAVVAEHLARFLRRHADSV